ncbi:LemA family protein [Patescibacteria group bacterium]
MVFLIIIVVVIAVVVLWMVVAYNGLVRLRNKVEETWSDIDVMLKRRYDLIPNVVNTVKGYAKHEKGIFEKVSRDRTEAISAEKKGPAEAAKAENMLAKSLKSLFAIAEQYPELKANQNFLSLQSELNETENKIQTSRQTYNGTVREFNTAQQVFPTSIIAGLFGFKPSEFFETKEKAEREVPEVAF